VNTIKKYSVIGALASLVLVLASPTRSVAEENDPPSRVARLAYLEGPVSFRPGGTDDWVDPGLNRPLTIGDQVWSDRGGRAELQLDGSLLRLGAQTSASILNLSDHVTQIQLSSGSLIVNVRRLDDDENYEIDTPNVAFSILRPGVYRLDVDADGQSTAIVVRYGQGEATGGGSAYTIHSNEYDTFTGTQPLEADSQPLNYEQDDFEAWSSDRDKRYQRSPSARYVSPDVIGYEDLDNQGDWGDDPEYGHVWYPNGVEAGWAPYHFGHWAYIAPWGYTWVDDRPWGFAPFHYGRWVSLRGRWGWVPAPPRIEGVAYVRPVYAPALVAWVGAGAAIAWFPLAPREVFVPSYPVSRRYLNEVNVSNTRVNTTIINNVYNTTIINKTEINDITYANRRVPGAVMATNSQAFMNAQPVARNRASVDVRTLGTAPVRAFAPAVVPSRQAVLGPRGAASVRPPAVVQSRVTTARLEPAARPPNFEQRQQAIRDNGGRVPSMAQVQRAAPVAVRQPEVRIAPPVRTLVTPRPEEHARAPVQPPEPARAPPEVVHANELPPAARPASPAVANSVLERQHSQEQQQLQARQEADRQRVQQQQEQEHRQLLEQQVAQQRAQQEQQAERLRQAQQQQQQQQAERQREAQAQAEREHAAQQQAQEAQRAEREREIELQHQQQTQQLMQEHARQQQEMQARQQEQLRQQAVQAPPSNRKPTPPPNQRQQ
jgi:hypothetical protein